MEIKSAENVMKLQLMTQMMKGAFKEDSIAFQMVLETMAKAMSDEQSSNDLLESLGLEEADLSQLGYMKGQRLNTKDFKNEFISNPIGKDLRSNNIIIEESIKEASEKYGVDEKLIRAIIKQESNFDPKAKSWAGAMGLMQLMPENVKEEGVKNPYDIKENIYAGTRHFKKYLNQFKTLEMALSAYNAGPGTMARRGVDSIEKADRLPLETQNYIKKVMGYYKA
ncbi:lytic transglycosylase domain-containing protein [Clostridium algidicarnis]|uniref:lytic transglycosylase domain-containing protein n=1 Tax=Clostridium algidicarnis TaxID=37659 RepID=UPI001C0CC06B|nr:lytic transglycosylase domain-containing protein [Clostridium algidicarnis]MBU3197587.1 lytic transglycosylase domain-containing protein [Clostridium algidicarnis]MBU3228930.1 lytic transglycosylase domain-containing protein [Clostridium algidicarnis]MBU3252474.1 lytic transglycosylase domain-containing protein [Clostridium algidicarnis]